MESLFVNGRASTAPKKRRGGGGGRWGEEGVKVSQTFGSCMYCLKCKETPSENDFQSSL